MPLYEYQCAKCGTVTDIRHGFNETTDESCAKCGGALKRLFNPAGIVFKGSGFYVTDSRKAESKTDSKTESKPESKPESAPASAPAAASGPKSDAAA